MNNKFVYTPGPTMVRENVRFERAKVTTNPDLDEEFVEFYKKTCDKFGEIVHTKNDVYILCGEGILGLEAACASITEPGDRVLVIDNGLYGKGFDGFVEMYGGKVVYFSRDYTEEINVEELEKFLEADHDFKYATVVHCDTPTGMLNDISKICPLLKSYGILTVVDSVSGMVGEEVRTDDWGIDLLVGGSQKAISAPTGLTMVAVSKDARKAMEERETPVVGFYCNLNIWKNYYKDKWFPYTVPISDIMGLDRALQNILDEGIEPVIDRHKNIAFAVRKALTEYGLELFNKSGYSNTVTVVNVPESIGALQLKKHMLNKYNVLIATSLESYTDKVIRIGHMGENAKLEYIIYVLQILDQSLKELGFDTSKDLVQLFHKYLG